MTIQDVAKIAGVSKSTVSRYLNGGSVSKKSALKINEAIKKTSFKKNLAAQRLRNNKSFLIGILVDGVQSISVTNVLRGINSRLLENGYQPFYTFDEYNHNNKLASLKLLVQQGIDGLIFGASQISQEHKDYLHSLNIPVVILGQKSNSFPYCKVNDNLAGKILGDFVNNLKLNNIVYLAMPQYDLAAGEERFQGFKSSINNNAQLYVIETGYDWEDAYKIGDAVMKLDPDIIIGSSDNLALGILQYIGENVTNSNIRLAGFGNYPFGSLPMISLTTISFDYFELGRDAASKIIQLINNEKVNFENVNYDIELIVRNSTH